MSRDEFLKLGVKCLQEQDVIEPVEDSEWISPVVIPWEKDNAIRVCIDHGKVNDSIVEKYPIPNIGKLLSELRGSTVLLIAAVNAHFLSSNRCATDCAQL